MNRYPTNVQSINEENKRLRLVKVHVYQQPSFTYNPASMVKYWTIHCLYSCRKTLKYLLFILPQPIFYHSVGVLFNPHSNMKSPKKFEIMNKSNSPDLYKTQPITLSWHINAYVEKKKDGFINKCCKKLKKIGEVEKPVKHILKNGKILVFIKESL